MTTLFLQVCLGFITVGATSATTTVPSSVAAGDTVSNVMVTPDSALAKARAALAAGRPWAATIVLAPVIADVSRRTPEVVFVAAVAASRWSGWRDVGRLLQGATWLDSLFEAEGRRLSVRAALERGADVEAIEGARLGLLRAPEGSVAAADLQVFLARGLDRRKAWDSASVAYAHAASLLPEVSDWLHLRAVAVTTDSATRAALTAKINDPLARGRIPWAVASAREASGDLSGAAHDYAALGALARSRRLRLTAAGSGADSGARAVRASIRRDLLRQISEGTDATELRESIALLDSAFSPLSPEEQLGIARAARSALAGRAADGYRAAFAAGLGTIDDRFAYASTLFRLGRNGDAAFQFSQVSSPHRLAGEAAYQRARALVRDGQASEGNAALLEIDRRFGNDTVAGSSALYLRGDLATDRRADEEGRTLFRRVVSRYPTSRFAPTAAFRAAIIAFVQGNPATAAAEFDQLAARYAESDEALAATYWAGRAWQAAGDTAAAAARWRRAVGRDPLSYYASLAARRLGQAPWAPAPAADSFIAVPEAERTLARAALLERIGLIPEAGREYRRLTGMEVTRAAADRALAVADALRRADRGADATRLALRARSAGATPDARLYRLLYPVIHRDALLAEAREQGLDPNFLAALIRQESLFDPAATSPAGARGLTQIMPAVGAELARSRGYPTWDPVLLYQPDVSLQLGAVHLRELAELHREPVRILAAYNAGTSRVARWAEKPGVVDPELFAERIPYVETRHYVRIIQRNEELYRALYP